VGDVTASTDRLFNGLARISLVEAEMLRGLAGMAGDDIAVGQVPEIPANDPAVIDDDVAACRKSLDGKQ